MSASRAINTTNENGMCKRGDIMTQPPYKFHPVPSPLTNPPGRSPTGDDACANCGYLDVPQYQDEIAICPGCGSVLADVPSEPASWLAQWPANRRSTLANFFYAAVRTGVTSPPAIVAHVTRTLARQLSWTSDTDKRQVWCQVLDALQDGPPAAQAYAAEVLAIEQLPAAEKAARKQEKSKTFVLEAMKGKEATQKQHWMLRSLGHTGELPADRAEASELIDRLLHAKGGL
jgi:hypothetical protein